MADPEASPDQVIVADPLAMIAEVGVVKISTAEAGISDGSAERIALAEHDMRRGFAGNIQRAFILGNLALWGVIGSLIMSDIVFIACGLESSRDRVIDRGVVKVLIGATVVQIGLIMVTITGNLFPKDVSRKRSALSRFRG